MLAVHWGTSTRDTFIFLSALLAQNLHYIISPSLSFSVGGAVPNSLYTGDQQQQLGQPMQETPLNESNPHLSRIDSYSSSSSLSPLSPVSRAGSGASTLGSMGVPDITSPPSGVGSLPSQPSMDSSQHQFIASNGQSFTANRRQLSPAHQGNAVVNNGVQHIPQNNPQPMYGQRSTQDDTRYQGVHPESQQYYSQSTGQPSQTNYGVINPNTQQSNYGHQHPESQPSYPVHPVSQPSYPVSHPYYPVQSPPSTQSPAFHVGEEPLQYSQPPYLAAVFNMEEEKQQQSRNQQLQSELARKDSELRMKEDNIMQYQTQLMGMQARINSVADQHQGKEREYEQKISELETLLKRMTNEAELQRKEMQTVHQQLQVANPQSAQDDDDYYKMSRSPHGVCLIVNNYEFHHSDPDKQHPRRNGADVDVHNLTQTFKYLRYKVEVKENLSSTQMQEELLRMANRSHAQYDSFICCILTHGEQGVVHGSDCEAVNLNDLAGVMKMCPSLFGKPKLFFVQACRGDQETKGFDLPERDTGGGPYHNTIPQEADFYFGFATPTGSSAYRSRRYGSWFISEVCQVFIKHSYTHDLGAMMVKVNKRVSDAYTKDGYKQAPESVNRLRFQVHFFRFIKGIGHWTNCV